MIQLLGYVFFIFVGLFFGLFGSGGSIIMLPIFWYMFELPANEAKTYSLLLVFLISFFGTMKHKIENNIHLQKIYVFVIPTLFFTGLSTIFLFPKINTEFNESFLRIIFSIVVFCSGILLLISKTINIKYNSKIVLILTGILVGVLTGLLGIGGGFIIVPALIVFAHMDMKKAASTALFIIMLNTLFAIILEMAVFNFQFQFDFIAGLLGLGILGVIIGINMLNRVNVNIIKKMFSITLLLLSLIIFLFEVI